VAQDCTKAAAELTALGGSANTKLAGYLTKDAAALTGSSSGSGSTGTTSLPK